MKYLLPALLFLVVSCTVRNESAPPTPQEFYYQNLSSQEKITWDSLETITKNEEVLIDLPYQEALLADSINPSIHAYNVDLKYGEEINIELESINAFVEIFKITKDSLNSLLAVYEQDYLKERHRYEVGESGGYFIRIRTKLGLNEDFNLKIFTKPAYSFPVLGGKERDIGSFWGDPRDGGRRKHKGIDIFAKRGKPLIACVAGRVRRVKESGLGGKQIWLADSKRKQSIYYAHLNEQLVQEGQFVERGDTIGTVGNTGNAKTTPPHLHFGIYKSGIGAIDPLYFVKRSSKKFIKPNAPIAEIGRFAQVVVKQANLRVGPSNRKGIISKVKEGEKMQIIGVSGNWYHVRSSQAKAGYIYKTSLQYSRQLS